MYVYQITNLINNKQYIGITNNYKKRWGNHKCCNTPNSLVAKAIKKYGVDNFKFEILYSGLSIEEAEGKEIELIKKKNTKAPNGYNIKDGGRYASFSGLWGEDNPRAYLTNEQAQYIKDHRYLPEYVLYEEFSEILPYDTFQRVYSDYTYKHIKTNVTPYPYNAEFSAQFINSKIDYGEVVELRKKLAQGVYWRDAYEDYKHIYGNEWSFWAIYVGRKFPLVMPEVLTKENLSKQSSIARQGDKNGRALITDEEAIDMREMFKSGKTREEILKKYPWYPRHRLNALLRGASFKHLPL